MNTTINITTRKNYLKLFWNWLVGNMQTVEYGNHIHFKGKDNKTGNVEVGSVLYGWHKNDKGEHVFGSAYVEKIDGQKAYVKLSPVTQY